MINTQKASTVIVGIVLALTAFLIGKSLPRTIVETVPTQNTSTPSIETQKKNIFDLANEYKPYSVGESRDISPTDRATTDLGVDLGVMYDVKEIFDEKNAIKYRIYRVGYDDEPPTYYAGRIIIETVTRDVNDYIWNYYVTEIADLNYLGTTEIQGNNLTVACNPINNSPACSYSIEYHKDTSKLSVKKLK